ncbi:T-cell surface glycoprotein CD3 epsilon chain [Dissostichus eleginoides]|uniref:T-cell surface glycoprotein CD3 epsilon chain n=1 Tax=Dissostichus eleginoides TaxID=100907 RepID=A0AAD9CET1_DISEL|nr:T-cell surface glycoprotein CD3 epsilon chain [Dissostichus eleginoides]
MSSMCVRAALAVLLFIATVEADKGGVTFWGEEFTMTCPEKGIFYKEGNISTEAKQHTLKGKTCVNCFELDATLFGLVIAADVVGTVIMMIIIYRCTKKKSSAGPTQTSKAPARTGGRAPAVPSPDYEPLNLHTRSQDPYSVVNRMG